MEQNPPQDHIHESTLLSPKITNLKQSYLEKKKFDVNRFWEEIAQLHTPIIEVIKGDSKNFWVTFLVRNPKSDAKMAVWAPNLGQDLKKLLFERFFDTDIYYKCFKLPGALRTTYKIINHPENKNAQNNPMIPDTVMENFGLYMLTYSDDPLNPEKHFYYGSILELPNALPQIYHITREPVPKGTVTHFRLKSEMLEKKKRFWVYVPNVSKENLNDIAFLCVFDGDNYQKEIPTQTILDNLIFEKKIPPTFALFLDNSIDRETDLPCNHTYADYVVQELIPWIQSEFHIKINPQKSIVAGSSYGGLAAAYFGLVYSKVFKNVIALSGSFYSSHGWNAEHPDLVDTWLIEQYRDLPHLGLQFFIEIGTAEQVGCSRHIRDVLIAKGYNVEYHENEGGHDYIRWRGSLADGILSLIGLR